MTETRVNLCEVIAPEGVKHYFTVLPLDLVFSKGLIPEAIVGALRAPPVEGQPIKPESFAENSIFVKYMHDFLSREAANEPECIRQANEPGVGWVYIVDQRTLTPGGTVPPEDIIGAVQAKDGQIVPDSYRGSPKHAILSDRGFFRLSAELHKKLVAELKSKYH